MGARVYINGDIMDLIVPQDQKRYSRGSDGHDTDAQMNAIIEEAETALAPYVDNIDMIGTGNHETAPLKYHAIDTTKLLIGFLNRRRNPKLPPIRHGGYCGFIRIVLESRRNNKRGYDIYYNHGQGGSSEVTGGSIDLRRRQYISADAIWLGHKHKRKIEDNDAEIGLDHSGHIYERGQTGVITGTYLRNIAETDADTDGYKLNYAEQSMRTPQGRGGVFLRLTLMRNGLRARMEKL